MEAVSHLVTVRNVDAQGRVALPKGWRKRTLKKSDEVILIEEDDMLLIRPRRKIDLTAYFDKIKVDIDPEAFADYNLLKRALLGAK